MKQKNTDVIQDLKKQQKKYYTTSQWFKFKNEPTKKSQTLNIIKQKQQKIISTRNTWFIIANIEKTHKKTLKKKVKNHSLSRDQAI